MSVKDRVLSLLHENKGAFVSGEEIAAGLCVSRAAIWKAIQTLRAEGYEIEASPRKGYALDGDTDLLSAAAIAAKLKGAGEGLRLLQYPAVSSTNIVAAEMAAAGERDGTVVLAEEQTAGKGRKGRGFFSPGQAGLYLSILLRPKYSLSDSLLLTTAAAVAVSRAIEAVSGQDAQIKWVNDVYINGKKVCGILTEAALAMENGGLDYAVVGIGVNVFAPKEGFPPELREIATALFPETKSKSGVKNDLAAAILNHFMAYYRDLTAKTFLPAYRERCFFLGKEIFVLRGNAAQKATALAIDDHFRLVVRYPDGKEEALDSGEVSVRWR
ncbi:MAG TPA: biotin--[acetyl-CoA-carboxylase] ligase [Clostridiales bacterium]|nr:biotin--[acetyl-CoA-carboxylase] ligase [Clostridiales bacterium]